jgi:hypothetical protein
MVRIDHWQFASLGAQPASIPVDDARGEVGESLVTREGVPVPVPETGERVIAGFAGSSAPPAPLTWGQRALWIAMRRRGPEQFMINMTKIVLVPDGAAVDVTSAVSAVGALVSRHSSLRTRIEDADGQPRQVVAPDGELPVLLFNVDSGTGGEGVADDGVAVARQVARQLAAAPFDHAHEWPQRVALVLAGDRVRQIVFVFSHTTVDLWAAEIVLRELRLLLSGGELETPPGPQSVDVARREQGADRSHSDRAVAHWVRGFGRLPEQTLPRVGPPLTPRFQRWLLVSEVADTASRLVAGRFRVTGSTVLLAATAAVLSAWSGTDVCGIHSMSNNRSLDGYRNAIAKLNQLALVVVDVADRPSFAELLSRVWRAALQAYRHAHYDPQDMERGYEAAGYPYATGVSPHCYFNDSRLSVDTDVSGRATAEDEVRAALTRSSLHKAETYEHFTWRLRVQVLPMPARVAIALTGDTGYLPPPEAERFLRDIERLLVEAAFRDVPWPWR